MDAENALSGFELGSSSGWTVVEVRQQLGWLGLEIRCLSRVRILELRLLCSIKNSGV